MSTMILAGDLGGTKTLLGLFEHPSDPGASRPRPIVVKGFSTPAFPDLTSMISEFADDALTCGHSVSSACFGVAGPVMGRTAALTNVPFTIDAGAVARIFSVPRVRLLNDLVAMAWSLRVLQKDELVVLQEGIARPDGHLALMAAGTGFNEALVLQDGGRFIPTAAESGHSDWAPRNEREIAVLRDLIERVGRAEVEGVLSGPGLVNIHRVVHTSGCVAIDDQSDPDAPMKISQAALAQQCRGCIDTMQLFVDACGAEAGNLALRTMATGGVFLGGGIAPKILPLLTDGRFMRAFLDKGRFRDLLTRVPVRVILNPQAGLLGAAVAAADCA